MKIMPLQIISIKEAISTFPEMVSLLDTRETIASLIVSAVNLSRVKHFLVILDAFVQNPKDKPKFQNMVAAMDKLCGVKPSDAAKD